DAQVDRTEPLGAISPDVADALAERDPEVVASVPDASDPGVAQHLTLSVVERAHAVAPDPLRQILGNASGSGGGRRADAGRAPGAGDQRRTGDVGERVEQHVPGEAQEAVHPLVASGVSDDVTEAELG